MQQGTISYVVFSYFWRGTPIKLIMNTNDKNLPIESFQYISTVLNAIAEISKRNSLEGIAKETCRQITYFVGANSCAISNWDQSNNSVKLWAEYLKDTDEINLGWEDSYKLSGYPLTDQVLQTGEPQLIRVDDPKADEAETKLLKQFNFKSLLMLPLYSDEKIIGLVEILSKEKGRDFSDDEIALVKLLLRQVGIEINHANLLKDAKLRTAELSAIRDASIGMISSREIEDVLKMILNSTLNLFEDVKDAQIFIYDNQHLEIGASILFDGKNNELVNEPSDNGLTYTVAKHDKMIAIEDISKDELYQNSMKNQQGAIISLPLRNQNRVVGVMNISFYHPRRFDESVLRVLTMLGDQAAVAIERSHNVEIIKKRAAELEALRQANLALSASLDLENVINTVLKSALTFSDDAMDAHIFIKEGEDLWFGGALWADGRTDTKWKHPRENGLTQRVAESGKIISVPNINENEFFFDSKDWIGEEDFKSIVGLPIMHNEVVIGVLNLAYNRRQKFSDADLRSLALLSDQAALAIENARLHQIVSEEAVTDALTGLPNRRDFELQLKKEVLRAKRYEHTFVLVMLDLNNFKWVNDTYGHPIGDKTLQMVGSFLKDNIRETDIVARLGGDEFGLILPETDKIDAIQRMDLLAEKIINHPFPWWKDNKEMYCLRLTVGIASFPEDAETAEKLILIADKDFYKAKKKAAK